MDAAIVIVLLVLVLAFIASIKPNNRNSLQPIKRTVDDLHSEVRSIISAYLDSESHWIHVKLTTPNACTARLYDCEATLHLNRLHSVLISFFSYENAGFINYQIYELWKINKCLFESIIDDDKDSMKTCLNNAKEICDHISAMIHVENTAEMEVQFYEFINRLYIRHHTTRVHLIEKSSFDEERDLRERILDDISSTPLLIRLLGKGACFSSSHFSNTDYGSSVTIER